MISSTWKHTPMALLYRQKQKCEERLGRRLGKARRKGRKQPDYCWQPMKFWNNQNKQRNPAQPTAAQNNLPAYRMLIVYASWLILVYCDKKGEANNKINICMYAGASERGSVGVHCAPQVEKLYPPKVLTIKFIPPTNFSLVFPGSYNSLSISYISLFSSCNSLPFFSVCTLVHWFYSSV